jgi:hypothetical protein
LVSLLPIEWAMRLARFGSEVATACATTASADAFAGLPVIE